MSEFLLEILQEDAPHNYQAEIAKNLTELFFESVKTENNIKITEISFMYSPKRISIHAKITQKEKLSSKKVRGPKYGASNEAIEGFAKKMNISTTNLIVENTQSGKFYFATVESNYDIQSLLSQNLKQSMKKIKFNEQMNMRNSKDIWVRQIINIICMYNDDVIDFEFGNIKSTNLTYGKITSNFQDSIIITKSTKNFYEEELRKKNIIACQEKRLATLVEEIKKINPSFDTKLNYTKILQAANIVDSPKVAICEFSKEFLKILPKKLIESSMEYDYIIPIKTTEELITNKFFLISNNITQQTKIAHENAIKRKLKDISLIFCKDKECTIQELELKTSKTLFYKDLGNLQERILRIDQLSRRIAIFIPYANIILVDKIAPILKLDSVSSTVRYKPELSGIVSAYLSKSLCCNSQEECEKIFEIIINYNECLSGAAKCLPETASFIIAESIDTMVGICSSTNVNTSHDPMGLRSLADLLVKTIIESNAEALHIKNLLENAIALYNGAKIKKALKAKNKNKFKLKKNLLLEITKLINSKFKTYMLSKSNISVDAFDAIMMPSENKCHRISKYSDDLCFCKYLIETINEFLLSDSGQQFISSYKRAFKISKNHSATKVKKNLFEHNLEKKLFLLIKEADSQLNKLIKNKDIEMIIKKLFSLSGIVNNFLDEVKVNDERSEICLNRMNLIKQTVNLVESFADFETFIK